MEPKDTSKKHLYLSLIKSAFRLGAAVFLVLGNFVVAGTLLFVAEILGIAEEL